LKTFRSALSSGAFTVTAELPPAGESSTHELTRLGAQLSAYVDGIQLAGQSPACAETSQTALAALLLRQGIDVTPTLNCRDRNRIALQSELLGLRAIGVSSLVLNQGTVTPNGQEVQAKSVFDVNCSELISIAQEPDESAFALGTTANIPARDSEWVAAPLLKRSSAGARFLRLLPCSDIDLLRHYLAWLVEDKITWHYSVIVSLPPLPAAISTALIRDMLSIPGVSGVNLLCQDDPDTLISAIEASGIRPDP
jgi:methylenetetrahydrofolate reductase (NADPH)